MSSYIQEQIEWFRRRWNEFWFDASDASHLVRLRLAVSLLAALWFAITFFDSSWWFGALGSLEGDLARSLSSATEGTWASRFRLSPLWSASAPFTFQLWAAGGLLLAIATAIGVGGRAVQFALFCWTLFLAQRLTWATGAFEPALIAALGYLVIDPGQSLMTPSRSSQPPRWSANFVTRLLQLHTWMLIVVALASQLASIVWWRGEAVWWLAATEHSQLLTTELLGGRILLVNALTHGITLSASIAVFALWPRRTRPIGVLCGCMVGAAYALVSDQMLYGVLLIVLLVGSFVELRPNSK